MIEKPRKYRKSGTRPDPRAAMPAKDTHGGQVSPAPPSALPGSPA